MVRIISTTIIRAEYFADLIEFPNDNAIDARKMNACALRLKLLNGLLRGYINCSGNVIYKHVGINCLRAYGGQE